MGVLIEQEIFEKLAEECRLAAEASDHIAVRPRKGKTYRDLRDSLVAIESCCRQACYWRGDTRWLEIGSMMAEAHKRAGDWLRGVEVLVTDEAGTPIGKVRRPLSMNQKHPLFVKLAENLRSLLKMAETLKNAATRQIGPILPEMYNVGRRVGAPVAVPSGMHALKSGLIVPDGVGAQ